MKRLGLGLRSFVAAAFVAAPSLVTPVHADEYGTPNTFCARTKLCVDLAESEQLGYYSGHDEPSLLMYSDTAGAGNNNVWQIQLPKDPPVRPKDDGTGGTWNFQLHPAFWFGMAICDTTSAPEFTDKCTADSDSNIFDDGDPASAHYIGKHPGTAFMELQFYPPSWVEWPAAEPNAGGTSCDAKRWCVALNVDSLLEDQNTANPALVFNNNDCRGRAGDETINFAFLTKNGKSIAPADPLISFAGIGTVNSATFTPDPEKVAFFNAGDTLEVSLHDTSGGLRTTIHDLDTGETGSMTAGPANGFAHLLFQPTASKCTSVPYAFHPMYSTASEHTRVPWAAHSYNIAFSDEIGHFEFCPNVQNASISAGTGVCTSASATDPKGADGDDNFCFTKDMSSLVRINGCTDTDTEFDGPEYFNNWPGTNPNHAQDLRLHGTPVRFTSALINGETNFDRVAYETDLPRIEADQACIRSTGVGCTNPPVGTTFYPIFTTGSANGDLSGGGDQAATGGDDGGTLRQACVWREGGAFLPNTRPGNFTTSTDEYGSLLQLTYPGPGFQPIKRFNDYRRVVPVNPCPAQSQGEGDNGAGN
jgi:hypothetical protein